MSLVGVAMCRLHLASELYNNGEVSDLSSVTCGLHELYLATKHSLQHLHKCCNLMPCDDLYAMMQTLPNVLLSGDWYARLNEHIDKIASWENICDEETPEILAPADYIEIHGSIHNLVQVALEFDYDKVIGEPYATRVYKMLSTITDDYSVETVIALLPKIAYDLPDDVLKEQITAVVRWFSKCVKES